MSIVFWTLAAAAGGYLLGAVPFGWLVARAHGVDILKVGSGNPGATNVKREVGKGAGNLVFLLDFLKGALAAGWPLLAGLPPEQLLTVQAVGLCAAILGHSFSIFLRGKGGKGVATTMGGLLALMPWVVLIGVGVWLVVFYATRYVSLASICFALVLPAGNFFLSDSGVLTAIGAGLAVLIIFRHRSNIQRLLNGTEHRFVRKPKNGAGI